MWVCFNRSCLSLFCSLFSGEIVFYLNHTVLLCLLMYLLRTYVPMSELLKPFTVIDNFCFIILFIFNADIDKKKKKLVSYQYNLKAKSFRN